MALKVGQKIDFLTIVRRCKHGRRVIIDAVCDCGKAFTRREDVIKNQIKKGRPISCGCKTPKRVGIKNATTHGLSKTLAYDRWKGARSRCRNPKSTKFYMYGAVGITFAEVWDDFAVFFDDMGECPKGMTLDRYPNPKGNYEPGNCRWATPKQQAMNRVKSVSVLEVQEWIDFYEEGLSLQEIASHTNRSVETVRSHLKQILGEEFKQKGERITKEEIDRFIKLRAEGKTFMEIQRITGRCRKLISRLIKEQY